MRVYLGFGDDGYIIPKRTEPGGALDQRDPWSSLERAVVAAPSHMIKECPDCLGSGVVNGGTDEEEQCLTCGGRGFVPADGGDDDGVLHTRMT